MRVIECQSSLTRVNDNVQNFNDFTVIEIWGGHDGSDLLDFVHEEGFKNVVLVERDDYQHRYDYAVDLNVSFSERLQLPVADEHAILFYERYTGSYSLMRSIDIVLEDEHEYDTSEIISHEVDLNGEFDPINF